MDITHQLTKIFCEIDDFCKTFQNELSQQLLSSDKKRRGPLCQLSQSEIATILIMFHFIRFRDFKTFYFSFVQRHWKPYFPKLPSYSRFIELIPRALLFLVHFILKHRGKETGRYYIDSSGLPVCHSKRHYRHKLFKPFASFGKSSVGWFFGLKIHVVINHHCELMGFRMSSGADSDSKVAKHLLENLRGLAFGDKGYLGKKLFESLYSNGLKLITRKRKNMKAAPLSQEEKSGLNLRNIVETFFSHLKFHYQIWHTRHRSLSNAFTHLVGALAAYVIEPLKISTVKLLS